LVALTTERRAKLASKTFACPSTRSYPSLVRRHLSEIMPLFRHGRCDLSQSLACQEDKGRSDLARTAQSSLQGLYSTQEDGRSRVVREAQGFQKGVLPTPQGIETPTQDESRGKDEAEDGILPTCQTYSLECLWRNLRLLWRKGLQSSLNRPYREWQARGTKASRQQSIRDPQAVKFPEGLQGTMPQLQYGIGLLRLLSTQGRTKWVSDQNAEGVEEAENCGDQRIRGAMRPLRGINNRVLGDRSCQWWWPPAFGELDPSILQCAQGAELPIWIPSSMYGLQLEEVSEWQS